MSNLDKALALAALGLNVFPCREKDEWIGDSLYESKSPYTSRGFSDAITSTKQIQAWWDANPEALVGVAAGASDIIVLDVDIDDAKGVDGFKSIEDEFLMVPQTFCYTTRRGGQHHIYRAGDTDLAPRKDYVLDNGVVLKGIDRRSGGSYIIWWGDVPESIDEFEEAPAWFCENSIVGERSFEGTVGEWLNTLVDGEPDVVVEAAINRIPVDDFGHNELLRIQTNLVKYGAERHPGVALALDTLYDAWTRDEYDTYKYRREFNTAMAGAVAKFGGRTEQEKEFWTRRPILEHLHSSSRALLASPWALLGGAILRTCHTIPYYVQYESALGKASLNMISVFVGDSGGGKTLLQNQLDTVLDFGQGFVAHEVGSGEAISEQFINEVNKDTGEPEIWGNLAHAEMFSFDEVGRLNAMQGRSGGTTVLEYLKTGWSGGRLGRRLVGGRGVEIPAQQYRMTAFLNAQPERADVLLSEDEIEGGFPGRVMWVGLMDPTVIHEYNPDHKVVTMKVKKPAWTARNSLVQALPAMNAAHVRDRMNFHTGQRDKLDGHELMLRVRIAIALMALDGRTELNEEDWELAEIVLQHSRTTRKMVQSRLSDKSVRDNVATGKRQGQREAIAKESADDFQYNRALAQVNKHIEQMQADGLKPTKGIIRAKMTRSLQTYMDDIWEALDLN